MKVTLERYTALSKEEKDLKKAVKDMNVELHMKTKTVIENLTDAEVDEMLYRKWIFPISAGMKTIPESIVGDLEKKVQALSSKYANTLTDIENEIHSAEAELCKMLDDLVGNEFDMAGLACLKKLLGGE